MPGAKVMDIFLTCEEETIQLPILPASFEVGLETGHQTIRTNNFGEVTLLGKRNCQTIEISSFFPEQEYAFARCPWKHHAYTYVRKINSWNSKVIKVLITSTNINKNFIITSWRYGEPDGTGDIVYTLALKEYRIPTYTKPKSNGKASTNNKFTIQADYQIESISAKKYTIKAGDTLKSIAKKQCGSSDAWEILYDRNKTVIEKAAIAHTRKNSYKNGVPGAYLYPGTKLTINFKYVTSPALLNKEQTAATLEDGLRTKGVLGEGTF